MTSPSIPTSWADVTAEWMTDAIAGVHPDAEVSDVEVLSEDDGTNRRARFGLSYTAAGSGPATVFAKAEAPAHREVHARNGNLFNEADLYASGVAVPLDHPRPYRVVIDRPGLDYVIVMEDVAQRGADPRDATRPLSIDQTANGVRSLAALHSAFWNFSAATRPELAWVQTWEPTAGFQYGLRRRVPTGLERAAGVLPDEVARFDGDEIVDLWARFVSSLTSGPVTLLHADPHIGNTYVLPNDEVGFLDWEVTRRGNWSQDLGYFVIGALTEEDRRSSQAELLDEYLAALDVPADTRPTRDEAWRRYRASAAYALAIWLSTLGTDGWQRREVSLALAQRFAVAFAELDTAAALDELGV